MPEAKDKLKTIKSGPWSVDDAGMAHLITAFDRRSEHHHFPPPPATLSKLLNLEERHLSSHGILYSYTVMHPHKTSTRPPFTLAYVDFPEGVRLMGRLEVPEGKRPVIGGRLETILETNGDGKTDYAFRAANNEAGK